MDLGLPRWLSGKEPTCQCKTHKRCQSGPGQGRCPGGGHGNPLQYSCLEKPMDRGAWWPTVHGVTKSWTPLQQQHAGVNGFKTAANMIDINPIILKSFKCERFKYTNYKTKIVNLD